MDADRIQQQQNQRHPQPPAIQPKTEQIMAVEEARLLNHCRSVKWGRVEIDVKNGIPVMIHVERRDIKLTD